MLLFPVPDCFKYNTLKNADRMYFLGFPFIVNVFAVVQALTLGVMECLWCVLLYGFEFQTVKVLMFDLD